MSSVGNKFSRASGASPGQVDPVVFLDALLAAATTKATNETVAVPPPQILVRWNSHTMVFSRIALQTTSLKVIYQTFTESFDLVNKASGTSSVREYDTKLGKKISYIPMILYVIFLRGSGAEAKTEHEASDREDFWRDMVPNIDEIHILTLPEYYARRKREEWEFQEALRGTKNVGA